MRTVKADSILDANERQDVALGLQKRVRNVAALRSYRSIGQLLDSGIVVVHICLVVLLMMNFHDITTHSRCKGVIIIWKIR